MWIILTIRLTTERFARDGLESRVKRLAALEPELKREGLHSFRG